MSPGRHSVICSEEMKSKGSNPGKIFFAYTFVFESKRRNPLSFVLYVAKSFLVQNIERKSYSSLAVKLTIPEGRGLVVV